MPRSHRQDSERRDEEERVGGGTEVSIKDTVHSKTYCVQVRRVESGTRGGEEEGCSLQASKETGSGITVGFVASSAGGA